MSFREVSIVVRAVNRASSEFARISTDVNSLAVRVRSFGAAITGLGATGVAITHIAGEFGVLNAQQTRVASSVLSVVTALGLFLRTSWGVAIAQKIYTAATALAANVTWVLNSALAMKIALLTLGIGLIVATAAYMGWLASTTRDAASAMSDYNTELERTPKQGGGSTSGGSASLEELRRRGVE
jgi:hypothetical protein